MRNSGLRNIYKTLPAPLVILRKVAEPTQRLDSATSLRYTQNDRDVLQIFLETLGRLFSENVQILREAEERVTMIKTFLAMMRDGKDGQAIVNDNDRILILRSLFRPSAVTGVDDSPPMPLYDIVNKKISGNG
jgi:hypothetical protein